MGNAVLVSILIDHLMYVDKVSQLYSDVTDARNHLDGFNYLRHFASLCDNAACVGVVSADSDSKLDSAGVHRTWFLTSPRLDLTLILPRNSQITLGSGTKISRVLPWIAWNLPTKFHEYESVTSQVILLTKQPPRQRKQQCGCAGPLKVKRRFTQRFQKHLYWSVTTRATVSFVSPPFVAAACSPSPPFILQLFQSPRFLSFQLPTKPSQFSEPQTTLFCRLEFGSRGSEPAKRIRNDNERKLRGNQVQIQLDRTDMNTYGGQRTWTAANLNTSFNTSPLCSPEALLSLNLTLNVMSLY